MSRNSISKLLLAAVVPGVLLIAGNASAITKEEVVTLAVQLMVPEADIIAQIEKDRSVFNLAIGDILELRKAGVPDGVIKFMMGTPSRYAAPAPAPAETGKTVEAVQQAPAAPVAPVVREKTPEEIEAERQRLAEEAERRAVEEKQNEEARRKAYASGKLRKGLALAEAGEWVPALELFQSFLKEENYAEDSIEVYNAKYGMAAALTNAGLYQSAARLLVEVLLQGTDKPFFQDAFLKLRVLRREVIYNPHELEMLTAFPVVTFSDGFQSEFNYVMGEYFYDIGDYERAVNHLSRVGLTTSDSAKAKYLIGLVQVRNSMYKSAVASFQEAVNVAEGENGDVGIRDLAYMGLARIAYEAENHDAAIFYYKKVPSDSPRAGTVFYELAWTYLMKGDYSRALGAFHAIRSPYFNAAFIPELWILEARVYGDLCYYDKSAKALEMFDQEIAVHQVPMRRFMDAQQSLESYYYAFLKSVNDPDEKSLPQELTLPVMANVEFYNLYRTIRQIEKESSLIRTNSARLGDFAVEMLERLDVLHKDNVVRCGVTVQRILKTTEADIERSQIHQTEIQVDISGAEIDVLNQELRALSGEETEVVEVKAKKADIVIGGDTEVWPFNGEYWLDEVPYFRSSLVSKCIEY